jgi:hypothetical protein
LGHSEGITGGAKQERLKIENDDLFQQLRDSNAGK